MVVNPRQQWFDLVTRAAEEGTLVRVSLAAPIEKEPTARRLRVRPVMLQAGPRLQLVWEYATQDVTKNFTVLEGLARLTELVGGSFRTAFAATTTQTAQLDLRRKGAPRLDLRNTPSPPAEGQHDRVKTRRVEARQPWLRALGITTAEGAVSRGMEAKFRQMHRFVELLEPLFEAAGFLDEDATAAGPLRIVDMGCGKGYLTFAAHEHFRRTLGERVQTLGVEVRAGLVEEANRHAREHHCEGLQFVAGSITETPLNAMEVLVALHACDTATDEALAVGIAAGATLLVVAPCCHREVRPQLKPPPVLEGALRPGIFRERQAEFVTDALRAALLEMAGYETRVFEFISPEHTAKNLMIAAVRRRQPTDRDQALRPIRNLAAFYGVTHQRLAERLGVTLGVSRRDTR